MTGKKVVLVVAFEGYQQAEYGEPKRLLEEAGVTVTTASNQLGAAIAKDGSTTPVDMLVQNINVDAYDAIIFIGGPGALDALDNESSYTVIKQAYRKQKIVGAICISTRILAKVGILQDKKATGWNGDQELETLYRAQNVTYVNQDVVVDDLIITAAGPAAAIHFGETIIRLLTAQNGWGD